WAGGAGGGGVGRGGVGSDGGGDDAAVVGPDAVALPRGRGRDRGGAPRAADGAGGGGLLLRLDCARNDRVSAGRRAGDDRDAPVGAGARRASRGRRGGPDRRRAAVHRVEDASPCLL